MITSPQNPPRWNPAAIRRLEPRLMLPARGRRSHIAGKRSVAPNAMMMRPETHFQKDSGTPMRTVEALRSSVKRMSETPSEATMTKARRLLALPPSIEPPTMTGKRGRTHGASTVKTPATNEISRSVMRPYWMRASTCASVVASPHFAIFVPSSSTCTNVCW